MAEHALVAQPREVIGKQVGRLRKAGLLPAVVYGPLLAGPRSLQLDYKEFETVYRLTGTKHPISLTIGDSGTHRVIIKDVQYNLLKRQIDHVDFYAGPS